MSTPTETVLKRYKLGLTILLVVAAGLAVAFFIMTAGERTDRLTLQRLEQAYQAYRDFSNSHRGLPEGNEVVKIHPSIKYERLGESSYLLCANFKTTHSASINSESAADAADIKKVRDLRSENPDTNYVLMDTGFSPYHIEHKPGRNCFYLLDYNGYRFNTPIEDDLPQLDMPNTDQPTLDQTHIERFIQEQ